MSDRKKDLFYKEVEGRMESLKRRPAEKEKTTRSEKINVTFNVIIGLVILLGVIFTLFRVLGGSEDGNGICNRDLDLIPRSCGSDHPAASPTTIAFNRCDQ